MKLKNIALMNVAIGLATISTAGFTKMTAPTNNVTAKVKCSASVVCKISYASKSFWLNARGNSSFIKLTMKKNETFKVFYDVQGERRVHNIKIGMKNFSIIFNNKGKYKKIGK